jgi:chemotaxis protein methyltransferase CheR
VTETDETFTRLSAFVEDELSFATSHYNDSYLKRRLSSRMRRTGSEDYDEYLRKLMRDEGEQQELLDALSINVTGFFRNPDVWDGIRDVLRDLSATGEPVHIWSAACADGREPYSLAMLAMDDPKIDAAAVEVLATDINDSALSTARRGVYESSRTIDIGEQLEYLSNYETYVECAGDRFTLRDEVRERVTFDSHDLINGDPKSGYDLVLCRNLFIYIDNEYKEPILGTVARSLRSRGYLVIGKAETIPPQLKSAFEVVDGRMRIYRRS